MTEAEAIKCRIVAQQFRALKEENQKLRDELAEKHRIDLRMQREDEEAFALVNNRKPQIEVVKSPVPMKPLFDYDTAEIEPLDTEMIEVVEPERPAITKEALFYIRFMLLVLAGCGIWVAHHFGWIDLIVSLSLTIFLFLLASYFRFI